MDVSEKLGWIVVSAEVIEFMGLSYGSGKDAWTGKELRDLARRNQSNVPSNAKKQGIIYRLTCQLIKVVIKST